MKDEHNQEHDHLSQEEPESCKKACTCDEQQGEEMQEVSEKECEIKEDFELKYQEMHEKYLRVHADFENVKKRLERDKSMALEYAYEKIALDLLPVIDALLGAHRSAAEENKESALTKGLELTMEKLHEVLARHGIEGIECLEEFDPNFHNAIMQVKSEEKENGKIVQVLQQGYKYKGRVLRPAMVSIAKND
ncbi:nucleotide exchange factor GrpE [Helicobacter pylori]|uniref:nucleotide exchange factor GrpE n=1 Tax=Helicobacter pylori TaxID=210 RepID=UPI00165B924C|nr:nucleotide exchange factor GrpE [Helicobacter pylori]WQS21063.1 nucleotide exchange factor GrpE [Helicobacter pylori]WQS30401.1 nucleotide exchange factor GrpE [Helicobacter pylori]